MTEIKHNMPVKEGTYAESPAPRTGATLPQMILAAAQEQLAMNKTHSNISQDVMTEILLNAGLKATQENLAMLKMLMDNGLALTEENISKMNHAMKLTAAAGGKPDPAKALFMMQNNIRLTTANAAQLNGLVSGQTQITSQINNILQSIQQIADPALRAELIKVLTTPNPGGNQGGNTATTPSASNIMGSTAAENTAASATQTAPAGNTQAAATPPQGQPLQAQPMQVSVMPDGTPLPQGGATPAQPAGTAVPLPQGEMTIPQNATPMPAPEGNVQAQPGGATQTANAPALGENSAAQTTQQATLQEGQQLPPPTTQFTTLQANQNAGTPQSTNTPQTATQSAVPNIPNPPSPPLPEALTFRLLESTPADIDRFLNNLREGLSQVRSLLSDNASPEAARVLREVQTLSNHMDFTSQIRNQLYVQLPLFHHGQETQTTLHVYKDTKKQADGKKDTASALVALDTASLGHFETYIQKNDTSVHCQFRLDTPEIEQLVRDNVHRLEALLRTHNLTLGSFAFATPGKPYTLLDSPALFDADFAETHHLDDAPPRFDKRA
ncbi:MAG: flagellar hook-length control protein FliK [Defluviitaleaceae bacterium]|nr:flagellar hook-length control protein FliK [Defluviitaleaceae bacterium]MCL2273747.1 flagellar hook-length control protein FliK [Defluviitaleaceae bacterium]